MPRLTRRGQSRLVTVGRLKEVSAIEPRGIDLDRGLTVTAILLVPYLVLSAVDLQTYWLSVSFAALFVALSDLGGSYSSRLRAMGAVGLIGAALTAVGFAIGGGSWPYVAVAAFAVTLIAGLALRFGAHGFTAAYMLNSWFLIAISVPASQHVNASESGWLGQSLAWLAGAALTIAVTFVSWLLRSRKSQPSHFPEIPADSSMTTLTRPVILFALVRAVAVTISVAIAFGLQLPDADWMPIATLVAMKSSLTQATVAAEQRIAGTLIGALAAALVLIATSNKRALELAIVVFAAFAATVRAANYAIYCAGVAAAVLIAIDLPQPSNFAAEGRRVAFTVIGLGIGIGVLLLATLIQRRSAGRVAAAA